MKQYMHLITLILTISPFVLIKPMDSDSINTQEEGSKTWVNIPLVPKMLILGHSANGTTLKNAMAALNKLKLVCREWRGLAHERSVVSPLFDGCIFTPLSPEKSKALRNFLIYALSKDPYDKWEKNVCSILFHTVDPHFNLLVDRCANYIAFNFQIYRLARPFVNVDDRYTFTRVIRILLHKLVRPDEIAEVESDISKPTIKTVDSETPSSPQKNVRSQIVAQPKKKILSYEYLASVSVDDSVDDILKRLVRDEVLSPLEKEFIEEIIKGNCEYVKKALIAEPPTILMLLSLYITLLHKKTEMAALLIDSVDIDSDKNVDPDNKFCPFRASLIAELITLAPKAMLKENILKQLISKYCSAIMNAPGSLQTSRRMQVTMLTILLSRSNKQLHEHIFSIAINHNLFTEDLKKGFLAFQDGKIEEVKQFMNLNLPEDDPFLEAKSILIGMCLQLACINNHQEIVIFILIKCIEELAPQEYKNLLLSMIQTASQYGHAALKQLLVNTLHAYDADHKKDLPQ